MMISLSSFKFYVFAKDKIIFIRDISNDVPTFWSNEDTEDTGQPTLLIILD